MQISVLYEKLLRFIGDVLTTLVSLVDTAIKPDFVSGLSFNKLCGGEWVLLLFICSVGQLFVPCIKASYILLLALVWDHEEKGLEDSSGIPSSPNHWLYTNHHLPEDWLLNKRKWKPYLVLLGSVTHSWMKFCNNEWLRKTSKGTETEKLSFWEHGWCAWPGLEVRICYPALCSCHCTPSAQCPGRTTCSEHPTLCHVVMFSMFCLGLQVLGVTNMGNFHSLLQSV